MARHQFHLHISSHPLRLLCRRCRDMSQCCMKEGQLFAPIRQSLATAPRCVLLILYLPAYPPRLTNARSCLRARERLLASHNNCVNIDRSYGRVGGCHHRCSRFEEAVLAALRTDPMAISRRRGAVFSNDRALHLPCGCCVGAGRAHTPHVGASALLQSTRMHQLACLYHSLVCKGGAAKKEWVVPRNVDDFRCVVLMRMTPMLSRSLCQHTSQMPT